MSYHPRRTASLVLTLALTIVLVACGSGGAASPPPSTGPSPVPSTAPSATPAAGTIDHETGPTDVVLRYEEGGGFVPQGYAATQTPHFTLFGDGTVLFRDPTIEVPPAQGSVFTFNPMRTAKLTEEGIQALLAFAIGEGGLAAARPNYTNDQVADASTATFTIKAGGIKKTVSIYALGLDLPGGADALARASFVRLAQRLTAFDQGGAVATEVYRPTAYRGVLLEAPGVAVPDVRAWPWADLTVADFKTVADPTGLQFPHRALSSAEIDLLDVKDYEGGFQGLVVKAPDGTLYTLSLRPLLPGEDS